MDPFKKTGQLNNSSDGPRKGSHSKPKSKDANFLMLGHDMGKIKKSVTKGGEVDEGSETMSSPSSAGSSESIEEKGKSLEEVRTFSLL